MTISVLIIFSAFVICLFLSALILTKKKKTRSDKYLLAYLLFNALLFLGCFVYFQYLIDTPQILVMFGGIFQLPFLFLYSCSVFGKTISLKIKRLIFIPASYTIVIIIFLLLIMTESELTLTFDSSIYNAPFILKTCLAMEYLLPPVFYFYLLKLGYKYNRQLKQNFSAIEGLTLNWLKWLLIMELLSWFIFFIHSILPIYFFDKFTDYSLQVAFSSVLSIAMAFFGIRRTGIFVPPLEENIPPSIKNDKEGQSYSRSGLSEKRIKEIGDKIEESVNIRKIFINPELTISMIAKDIDEKPHHISQIFNQYYNTSFYDYINSSRIEEIKHKIEEGEATEKTLLALAMESGFNSKATFNRYFKKCTGKTPSEYQKMVSAKRLSRN